MLGRIAAVTVAVLVLALVAAPVLAQPKIPPDFSFDKGKDSPGTVTFSHEKHAKAAEKCTVCHTKVFKMKKGQTGPLTMEKMNAGEQCGTCHHAKAGGPVKASFSVDDKAACERCHKKS